MSKKKNQAAAPTRAKVPQAPPEATHFAVPLVVYGAVLKVLETLPFSQVNQIMMALQQCQPLSIPGGATPGDMAKGLPRGK